ncbi:helix-turn-helix domain-containing protein [Streptomyces bottropensis]|jgi:hypothetical protein
MATHVKRAFKSRFYPADAQAAELSRTFGCVRKAAFRFRDGRLTLARTADPLDIAWSRPLPEGTVPNHGDRQPGQNPNPDPRPAAASLRRCRCASAPGCATAAARPTTGT